MANGGIQGQSGTVEVSSGSSLDLSAAAAESSADELILQTNGALDPGANDIVVSADYLNADFGTGNAFDARANVSGTGEIRAVGDVAQEITGDVTDGTQATVAVDFGNVRVGDGSSQLDFQVKNAGTTGPSLRGAVQDTGLTDARLTGPGDQNYGPLATQASSGDLSVALDVGNDDTDTSLAGALGGQSLDVVNNFDNVVDQSIEIQGAAFMKARGELSTLSVDFRNFHTGAGTDSRNIGVSNIAEDTNGFTEQLDVQVTGSIGNFQVADNTGLVDARGTVADGLVVTIDTGTAGGIAGGFDVNSLSNGTNTSGLAATDIGTNLGTQTVSISGAGYLLASGDATAALDFGAARVGDAALVQTLTIANASADTGGFTETLTADIGAAPFNYTTSTNQVSGIGEWTRTWT